MENGESRDHLGRESAGDCNGEWNGSGPSHNRLPVSSQNHSQQSGDSLIVSYFNYYVILVSDKAQDAREQGNICRQVAHLVVLLKCYFNELMDGPKITGLIFPQLTLHKSR